MTWERGTLRDLCLRITKRDPVSTGRPRIRYIDIGGVDGTQHRLTEIPEIDSIGAPSRCRQVVASGDTVFSTVRPYLEKIAYVDASFDGEFASTGFSVLRPGPRLEPKFLHYFTLSQGMFDQILPYQKGVSYPAVLDREVRSVSMPVPPLEEQGRIVEILEEHLSRLDAAEIYLSKALRGVDTLRKVTLARLHDWPTALLAGLAIDASYGTSAKCVADGPGPAVVRIPNLLDGRIDLTDEKRVAASGVDVTKSMLSEGDLLIVRTNGSLDLIGRSAVVPANLNAAFASYLIRYRLCPDLVRPHWVNAMLSTPQIRLKIENLAASSAGQHNLSLSKLGSLAIPLPPLAEQDHLLDDLSSLDADRTRLLSAIASARSRSANLRRSVLAAAFSGRLSGSSNVMSEIAGGPPHDRKEGRTLSRRPHPGRGALNPGVEGAPLSEVDHWPRALGDLESHAYHPPLEGRLLRPPLDLPASHPATEKENR